MGRMVNSRWLKGKYSHRRSFGDGWIYERRMSTTDKTDVLNAIRKIKARGGHARYTTYPTRSGKGGFSLWISTGKRHGITSGGNKMKRRTTISNIAERDGYFISSRGKKHQPKICNGCGRPAYICSADGGC